MPSISEPHGLVAWEEVAEIVKVPHPPLGLMLMVTTLDGRTVEMTVDAFEAMLKRRTV